MATRLARVLLVISVPFPAFPCFPGLSADPRTVSATNSKIFAVGLQREMSISACSSVERKVASYPGQTIASALALEPLSGSCVCANVALRFPAWIQR